MSPSHTVKNGKRYRYYLIQAYLRKQKELAASLPQVPASYLEQTTSDLIKKNLEDSLNLDNYSIEQYEMFKSNLETHFVIKSIISKLIISHINVIYCLNPKSLEEIYNLIIVKQKIINY